MKQHQMCSCSCSSVLHTRVFCPVCINKKPENVTLLSLCWPAGADVLKCACSCICRSVCWLADVQGLGLGEEVQLALKADDEKKKCVVVVELTLATGSVRQPIEERDAFNDIIKSSHPATAIT